MATQEATGDMHSEYEPRVLHLLYKSEVQMLRCHQIFASAQRKPGFEEAVVVVRLYGYHFTSNTLPRT
jgi:hypothetical protein